MVTNSNMLFLCWGSSIKQKLRMKMHFSDQSCAVSSWMRNLNLYSGRDSNTHVSICRWRWWSVHAAATCHSQHASFKRTGHHISKDWKVIQYLTKRFRSPTMRSLASPKRPEHRHVWQMPWNSILQKKPLNDICIPIDGLSITILLVVSNGQ